MAKNKENIFGAIVFEDRYGYIDLIGLSLNHSNIREDLSNTMECFGSPRFYYAGCLTESAYELLRGDRNEGRIFKEDSDYDTMCKRVKGHIRDVLKFSQARQVTLFYSIYATLDEGDLRIDYSRSN